MKSELMTALRRVTHSVANSPLLAGEACQDAAAPSCRHLVTQVGALFTSARTIFHSVEAFTAAGAVSAQAGAWATDRFMVFHPGQHDMGGRDDSGSEMATGKVEEPRGRVLHAEDD